MFCGFSANGFLTKLREGKWIDLFDGKSLVGWKSLADGQVEVNDGEIQMLAKNNNLWLINDKQFTDFELLAEVKMPTDPYNSGIAFRCIEQPNGRPSGYQCEIAESESGMLFGIGKGWIWPKTESQKREFQEMSANSFETGNWNHFRIKCIGDNIQIWVNGIQTADVIDSTFETGAIAIQHHGKGGIHRFRNITIREILPNGKE
jgi:hypothetical protein